MGDYTRFEINVLLKEDTPEEVMDILHFLAGTNRDIKEFDETSVNYAKEQSHPFFATERWAHLFLMSSAYFVTSNVDLSRDEFAEQWQLCGTSSLKNYDGEIGKFFDWIMPWIDAPKGAYIGSSWCEYEEQPTAVFLVERKGRGG